MESQLSMIDACTLIANDVGQNIDSTELLAIFQSLCISGTLSKFTCDVIRVNWNVLWKEFIVNTINGHYCKNLFT